MRPARRWIAERSVNLLITLRNAQVRRISWVRGVRPAGERCEWPPHDTASRRPPTPQFSSPVIHAVYVVLHNLRAIWQVRSALGATHGRVMARPIGSDFHSRKRGSTRNREHENSSLDPPAVADRGSMWNVGLMFVATKALAPEPARYLILVSRNSTCFLATGSYFFLTSLSVMVREFFLAT